MSLRLVSSSVPRAAAVLAALLLCALGCLQSTIWHGAQAPALARRVAAVLDSDLLQASPASELGQPAEAYFGYGRMVLVAYGLLLVAARALRPRLPSWGSGALAALGSCALGGDVIAYWLSETTGPAFRRIGFWYLELPALVLCSLLLTAIGVARFRRDALVRPLAAALPFALLGSALLRYLPHGVLLGLALTLCCLRPTRPSAALIR